MVNPPITLPPTPFDQFFTPTPPSESLPPPYQDFASEPNSLQANSAVVFPPYSLDPNDPNSLVAKTAKLRGFPDDLTKGAPDGFYDTSVNPPVITDPSKLDPRTFETWASEYQAEYLHSVGGGDPNNPAIVTIGGGTLPTIHAMLTDGAATGGIISVYVIENLSAKDFAAMSLADQNFLVNIANNPADPNFGLINGVLTGLGLSVDKTTVDMFNKTDKNGNPVTPVRVTAQNLNDLITNKDINVDLTVQPPTGSALGLALADINSNASLTDDQKQIYIDELNNIEARLGTQAIFSPDQINSAANDVQKRFDTVASFAGLPQPSNSVSVQGVSASIPPLMSNVVSLDAKVPPTQPPPPGTPPGGSASIGGAVQQMLQAERQILAADNAMLAATGLSGSPSRRLDAPDLLAAYMENAALKDQAINAFDTQSISQLNNLIDLYNTMEELINQTLQKFDGKDDSHHLALLDGTDGENPVLNNDGTIGGTGVQLTPAQIAALSAFLSVNVTVINPAADQNTSFDTGQTDGLGNEIFDDTKDANGNLKLLTGDIPLTSQSNPDNRNPLEISNNVVRPTFPIAKVDQNGQITLIPEGQTQWNTFLTQLTDATTQLNQASQLAFSKVNSREQELATFDSSASSALSGALTLIQNIGQNMVTH
jgi:hypothetical protein